MKRYLFKYAGLRRDGGLRLPLPALSLMAGIVLALLVIPRTPVETIRGYGDAAVFSGSGVPFLTAYWKCSRYHILVALLSTSYIGAAVIPAVLGYRGFALTCASAAVMIDYPASGAALSAIVLGIPALITVPGLLVLAGDSINASSRLFSLRFGLRQRAASSAAARRALICMGSLIPAAILETTLLPWLAAVLIS